MLEICAIASGSNGNCYYIGNEQNAILIDAGISCKQILLRLKGKKLNAEKIRAVFISHEHSDHMRGARVLEKKLNIPVFLTSKTYFAAYKKMQPAYPRFFTPGSQIEWNGFNIHTFLKNHDASEPCSFRVEYKGINIGIFTDIGEPCENVAAHLPICDVLFLETNYDDEMLSGGVYPFFLKKRIASGTGHLSNIQAYSLLKTCGGDHLKCVFLSHLSAENNTPELAMAAIRPLAGKFKVHLTSRNEASEVFVFTIENLQDKKKSFPACELGE